MEKNHLAFCFFTILLSLSAFSCVNKPLVEALNSAESLLQSSPDSSLRILSRIDTASLSSRSLMARYALLYSLALDKNYIDSQDDFLTRKAVDYYQTTSDTYYGMLAWYSLGRVQMNKHDFPGAIISFTESEVLAKQCGDIHYLGLIERNLGSLYSDSYDSSKAEHYYRKSSQHFDSIGELNYAAYSKLALARKLGDLHRMEESDSLLNIIEAFASRKDSYLYSEVNKTRAMYWMQPPMKRDQVESAVSWFSREYRKRHMELSTNVFATMAIGYAYLHKTDSVSLYMSMASEMIRTPLDSAQYWNASYRIAELEGNHKKANENLEKAVSLQNRIVFARNNLMIANRMSDYYAQKAEHATESALFHRRVAVLSIAITILSVLLVITLALLYRSILKKKEKDLQEKEDRIQEDLIRTGEIMAELDTIRFDRSNLLGHVHQLIQQKIAVIQLWSDAYETAHKEDSYNPKDPYRYLDEDADWKKESNMKSFISSLEALRRDESLFHTLEENVNQWKDSLMADFRKDLSHHQLDERDFKIVLLSFAELSDKASSYLLDMTSGSVRTRKTRIRKLLRQSDLTRRSDYLSNL